MNLRTGVVLLGCTCLLACEDTAQLKKLKAMNQGLEKQIDDAQKMANLLPRNRGDAEKLEGKLKTVTPLSVDLARVQKEGDLALGARVNWDAHGVEAVAGVHIAQAPAGCIARLRDLAARLPTAALRTATLRERGCDLLLVVSLLPPPGLPEEPLPPPGPAPPCSLPSSPRFCQHALARLQRYRDELARLHKLAFESKSLRARADAEARVLANLDSTGWLKEAVPMLDALFTRGPLAAGEARFSRRSVELVFQAAPPHRADDVLAAARQLGEVAASASGESLVIARGPSPAPAPD